jgi:phosphoribosylformylglycinamidine synthase
MYKANIEVTLRSSILDPQGKAAQHALHNLGFASVDRVRIGKHVELWIDAPSAEEAKKVAEAACAKLLANPVMEDFRIAVEEVAVNVAD